MQNKVAQNININNNNINALSTTTSPAQSPTHIDSINNNANINSNPTMLILPPRVHTSIDIESKFPKYNFHFPTLYNHIDYNTLDPHNKNTQSILINNNIPTIYGYSFEECMEYAQSLYALRDDATLDSLKLDNTVEHIRNGVSMHLWELLVNKAQLKAHLQVCIYNTHIVCTTFQHYYCFIHYYSIYTIFHISIYIIYFKQALKDFLLLGRGEFFQSFIHELGPLFQRHSLVYVYT